uniref:Alternative protein ZNF75D n=1 Tax=Homo sapiens TaxID=9606 RepID=L8E8E0_HUMAN|nr:alternative protein ZNF75D [Homo sapiens]
MSNRLWSWWNSCRGSLMEQRMRSQPMSWERRQCSWEEQQWPQASSGSQQSPNQWVCSRKNIGIHTGYYKNSWAGTLTKKPSLYMKELCMINRC